MMKLIMHQIVGLKMKGWKIMKLLRGQKMIRKIKRRRKSQVIAKKKYNLLPQPSLYRLHLPQCLSLIDEGNSGYRNYISMTVLSSLKPRD